VLVVSDDESRAVALLRATAGLWETGNGRILKPPGDRVMFVSDRPYILPGSLRELLSPGGREKPVTDEAIAAIVRDLGLEAIHAKADGLDVERDWDTLLALGEEQLLVLARVAMAAPDFAFLYRIDATVGATDTLRVLRVFAERSITYVTFAETDALATQHDAVLELKDGGQWKWTVIDGASGPGRSH
jgi:putative ATP-binding cassette transporter